jgi:hypothetical protein
MDNHTRKLLGLIDEHSFLMKNGRLKENIKAFKLSLLKENWMTRLPIANTANRFVLSATAPIKHALRS